MASAHPIAQQPRSESVSTVEMVTPMALISKVFFSSVSTFETPPPYEALDSSGTPTRNAKRRGAGWLPGLADMGWSNWLGWYEGFHLLLAVNPIGVITGCGFGPASTKDHPLAETCFALRHHPHPGLASVGAPACGPYVVDKGFEGRVNQVTWWKASGAQVICPSQRKSRSPWSKRLRRSGAGVRHIVETVSEKLAHTFRLDRERPHDLSGLQARGRHDRRAQLLPLVA